MAVFTYDFAGVDTAVASGIPNPSGFPVLEVISGSWRRLANQAHTDTALGSNPILAVTIGTGSVDESASISGGGGDALYCRVTDATNWIRARVRSWTTSVQTYHPVSTYVNTSYYVEGTWYASGWATAPSSYSTDDKANSGTFPWGDDHGFYTNKLAFGGVSSYSPGYCKVYYWTQYAIQNAGTWVSSGYYRDDSYTTTDYTTHYTIILEKSVAGVITTLATSAEIGTPTSLRLLAVGSSIKAYYNNTSTALLSVTEAAFITIAKHGIGRGPSENDVQALDNFVVDGLNYPPSAVGLTPANGVGIAYGALTTFNWVFSDLTPGVLQAAYQVIVERNDTGALVWDSGKVFAVPTTASQNISSLFKDIALRWKVRVWDTENLSNGYSTYALFMLSDGPVVTIISPTNVGSSSPSLSWTFFSPAGREQSSFHVIYTKQGTGVPFFDSGVISTASPVYTPSVAIFTDGDIFAIDLIVVDTLGLIDTTFIVQDATYVPPTIIESLVDAAQYSQGGYVLVSWFNITPDPEFLNWRVYRKATSEASFVVIKDITTPGTTSYQDWLASSNKTYQYYVTQMVSRFGQLIESAVSGTVISVVVGNGGYWLVDPLESNNNLLLTVKSDSFTNEIEQTAYNIAGRGRHVDYGDELGISGSLVTQLRDNNSGAARDKLAKIKLLQTQRRMCYLRNPFGDLIIVAMGNISIDRVAGVGSSEFCDVTIPYLEVS